MEGSQINDETKEDINMEMKQNNEFNNNNNNNNNFNISEHKKNNSSGNKKIGKMLPKLSKIFNNKSKKMKKRRKKKSNSVNDIDKQLVNSTKKCRYNDCVCKEYIEETSQWMKGQCKTCNHKEYMHY